MPFAEINGFRMHYEVAGNGPPLVITHGLLSSIEMMALLGETPPSLADDFTVITYDARGHGLSGGTANVEDYRWDGLAEDMRGLFRHLGIDSAYVQGSSMGGGTAMVAALRHPEMVKKLVLLTPPPIAQQQSAYGASVFGGLALIVESLGLEEAVSIALRLKPWSALSEAPALFEWVRQWLLKQNADALVPAIRGIVNGPALSDEDFSQIKAPTLLIAHPDDELHPVPSAERLHSLIPNSRLVVPPDAMYYSLRRDELAALMKDFLNGE